MLERTFSQGASDWTSHREAFVSEFTRRSDTRSIAISQTTDDEADSHWLSPSMDNPDQPVKVSFWAADNYTVCPDLTYAASVDFVNYDADGNVQGQTMNLVPITWDESRRGPMWGPLLRTGMVWQYYEAVYQPTGDTFRLKFHWPKTLARGDAYVTDVKVTAVADDAATSQGPEATDAEDGASLALEISTPVQGNIFYRDDPLQFEVLVYSEDGSALDLPDSARLRYEVADYQRFHVGSGDFDFASAAAPIADESFYDSPAGRSRRENLHRSIRIEHQNAGDVGRQFFIEIKLVDDDGRVLAEDTVTYGVADPRPIASDQSSNRRFGLRYFASGFSPAWSGPRSGAVAEKMGVGWYYNLDYGWREAQPEYPGPLTFDEPIDSFPKEIFLPNMEQLRGRPDDHVYSSVKTRSPEGAVLPDPLRPGRNTFDIDAYVEYIVAYIRHNRDGVGMVVPAGLERPIDERTIELHKKAYTAIKEEFPDLPVGFMLYGLPQTPNSDVDLFLDEGLYDYAEFINEHFYSSRIDWTEWTRLQEAYKQMGREPVPLMSTEFSRVGGMDQVQRSRDMILGHLDAFAHDVQLICYYNTTNHAVLDDPFLRGPTDLGGDMNSGFLFMQQVDRPRVAPDIVPDDPDARWARGRGAPLGHSLMPILQTMTYYNLVQNFELARYRETIRPDADSIGYVFDRDDATILAMWLTSPMGHRTFLVEAHAPFVVQDLFGRRTSITPRDGRALITVDENPLTLIFEEQVSDVAITPVDAGLSAASVIRGASAEVSFTAPGDLWPALDELRIACTVDGTWPKVEDQHVRVPDGGSMRAAFAVTVGADRELGTYPLTAHLYAGEDRVGIARTDLPVTDALAVDVRGSPMTRERDPAIEVTLSNHASESAEGMLRFDDRHFATGMRRELREKPFHVPAQGQTTVTFPVSRELVNLTTAYEIEVEAHAQDAVVHREAEIAFRAVERAPGPITIDADLSDWSLDERTPVPFAREYADQGKRVEGPDDLSAELYTLWDDEYLYFAAVVKDDSMVVRANDVGIWRDDNIMLGLHPWGWQKGETLNSGYYREHLGLCADGEARIFRVGSAADGPTSAEGAKVAVKRTDDGYTYEWAYPRESLTPLELERGSRFRLSLYVLDRDYLDGDEDELSPLGGVSLGGFNTNVDARPEKWREFVLVE